MTINHDTINGLEASRRVGWARYFQSEDKVQELIRLVEELTDVIVYHNRLPDGDSAIQTAKNIRREAWRLAA